MSAIPFSTISDRGLSVENQSRPCVLAVDGGNTKTIAVVAALDGTLLGVARGGCGDIYNATAGDGIDGGRGDSIADSARAALANVERTVRAALDTARVLASDLVVGVFNMAGADWPEDIAFWRHTLAERGFGRRIIVQNDALGVLYIGSPDATGVSVICGTGVATGARAPDGRVWHTSYWQDEAQGNAHLGQKALFAVYRSALDIEPPTSLTARLLEYFGVPTVEAMLHLFHNRQHPAPTRLDRLTPLLLDEAHAGDAVAVRIVREHGETLGDIALAAARTVELHNTPFHLVLAGGVFRHPTTVLEDAIVLRVRVTTPGVRPVRIPHEPITGVLAQAFGEAGDVTDRSALDRVIAAIQAATR